MCGTVGELVKTEKSMSVCYVDVHTESVLSKTLLYEFQLELLGKLSKSRCNFLLHGHFSACA